jgi:hypothetical protein
MTAYNMLEAASSNIRSCLKIISLHLERHLMSKSGVERFIGQGFKRKLSSRWTGDHPQEE